ncbi:hypothetical protein BW12_07105 [Bifidobacterium sp. UTCIF-3]|uniref:hypothetical protein n=1 Tax=unclassified Bifidobacterium TaxID=2608897 RepID=UPI00112A3073|nr:MULTISPECIES: hypothetical protein [unclassified Bifidobacterium]TPF78345.1 hypothetical protein BW09_04640 [Bifidobacterium sp. UTCIF-1]TPF81234.1 hypothetical protein BW08_00940 [Bifidobacterium sp. UTCIF-24]TPF82015.1 hypothetical protein BW12_07105 [Bifidobacterium sp. UTCIF-3]TPF85137.1 hypothetical protein BW07_00245 [Bifidobacterium sp. UTCIF-36]
MTSDALEDARSMGRRLGLDLIRNIAPTGPSFSLRRATVVSIDLTSGGYTADLTVGGGTLHAIPITVDCLGCGPGDRVLVETYGTQSFVTGIIARPGAGASMGHAKFRFQDTNSFKGDAYGGANEIIVNRGARLLHVNLSGFQSTVNLSAGFPVWLYSSGPKPSRKISLGCVGAVVSGNWGKQADWNTDGSITLLGGLGSSDRVICQRFSMPIPDGVEFT